MTARIILIIVLSGLILVSLGLAETIYVPSDYPDIQAAVDYATDGDEILLADGVFTGLGNYDINMLGKAITVRSQNGNPDDCVIDIPGQHNGVSQRGFLFLSGEDSDCVVRDLTIMNGVADGP